MIGPDSEASTLQASNPARFHPAATREMMADARFYQRQRSGLGEDFLDEIDRALTFAMTQPTAGRSLGDGFRWVLTRRFRYAVIYRDVDGLEVIAIAHLRRRPGYWRSRVVK